MSIDDKEFVNDVKLFGVQVGVDVRSRPLTVGYLGKWNTSRSEVNLSISYSANLGSGSKNDDLRYILATSRPSADSDWEALRFSIDASYTFKNEWRTYGKLMGQDTQEPLIPGE